MLAGGRNDGLIRFWDVTSGQELAILTEPDGSFQFGISFSPDFRFLTASDLTNRTRVFVISIEDLVTLARTRVTRTLTKDECRQYLHLEECP